MAESSLTSKATPETIILRPSRGWSALNLGDLWAYRVPAGEPGVCEITASGGAVNRRTGPGVAFDIAGVLDDGATATATAQSIAPDGLTWWQLADTSWVREDVVTEQGACRALPSGG